MISESTNGRCRYEAFNDQSVSSAIRWRIMSAPLNWIGIRQATKGHHFIHCIQVSYRSTWVLVQLLRRFMIFLRFSIVFPLGVEYPPPWAGCWIPQVRSSCTCTGGLWCLQSKVFSQSLAAAEKGRAAPLHATAKVPKKNWIFAPTRTRMRQVFLCAAPVCGLTNKSAGYGAQSGLGFKLTIFVR